MDTVKTIFPLADRILVRPFQQETKTASGLALLEEAQVKKIHATVLAVGPGTDDESILVKPGDHIIFQKYAGTQILNPDNPQDIWLMIRNSDIFAIVPDHMKISA